jgi:mRNA interferase YafQ
MYKVVSTKTFRKNYKKLCKSGCFDVSVLNKVINTLSVGKALEEKYKDHSLTGRMEGFRECHIKPDLLLIYKIYQGRLILELVRLGSHSELFD